MRLVKLVAVGGETSGGRLEVSMWAKCMPRHGRSLKPKRADGEAFAPLMSGGARGEHADAKGGDQGGGSCSVHIDVLDETDDFAWLGAWERTELSQAWTHVRALIHVPRARTGHILDVSLVVGGCAPPGIFVDDAVVTGPPVVGGGVPVRALSLSFDDAAPPRVGLVRTSGAAALGGAQGTMAGGGDQILLDLRSRHAALSGVAGAMIDVRQPLRPPAAGRLLLCHVVASVAGVLKVVFWARTPAKRGGPLVTVDLVDVDGSGAWLGTTDSCKVGNAWKRFEVEHQLGPTRVGHRIEVSLQVGRAAGILLLDDIEVWAPRDADGRPPRLLPPPLPSEPSR